MVEGVSFDAELMGGEKVAQKRSGLREELDSVGSLSSYSDWMHPSLEMKKMNNTRMDKPELKVDMLLRPIRSSRSAPRVLLYESA
jgi:hypothetical protein